MYRSAHASIIPRWAQRAAAGIDVILPILRSIVWPKLDLLIRLGLAQAFFVSGVLKLTHWQSALYLAEHEYPLAFLSPGAEAVLGVSIEVAGSVLLALGFMTRYAAAALLALTLVIQLTYRAFDHQLVWMALFVWYALAGAASLSVDALLRRGLADSALPGVPHIVHASDWTRAHLAPLYLSLLRLWLALALLSSAHALERPMLAPWLPLELAANVPAAIARLAGTLLLLGLGTRFAAVLPIVALFTHAMTDPRETELLYLLMVLALLLGAGGGPLALDRLLLALTHRLAPARDLAALIGRPRVVIIGAGFAGIRCAARLRHAEAAVTLIDRANYHLFQPLLYQVATAALSPGDIASPVRPLFRDAYAIRVLLGTATGIDAERRCVRIESGEIPYDYLVLATGAMHSYFGQDEWAAHAPGLKRIEDALEIRRRILTAFEHAESSNDRGERAAHLTFVIVGGGPTGVELAGAIAELARFGLESDFRSFNPADARILLVQSAPRLLPSFAESLSATARRSLEQLGVEVLLGRRVEHIDASGVTVSGEHIAARTVLWAAGVKASPAARWLGASADASGRIRVEADLTVPGHPEIYAIGDTAASTAWQGELVPGLAPAAKQQGTYVAKHLRARFAGRAIGPFRYRHRGSLATIGRKAAVVDFGAVKLWGAPAWWLWGVVHLGFLAGVRNRIATMINWFWAYLTFRGGIRLITGAEAPRIP